MKIEFNAVEAQQLIETLKLKVVEGEIEPDNFKNSLKRFLKGEPLPEKPEYVADRPTAQTAKDPYTHSNFDRVRVVHADLDLIFNFEKKQISGTAIYSLGKQEANHLILDTKSLLIREVSVELKHQKEKWEKTTFRLGKEKKYIGSSLTIDLPQNVSRVKVIYETDSKNIPAGLQWLEPQQTASEKKPFLYTQGQYYHNRGWAPLQDTPRAKMTFLAVLRVKSDLGLRAVMVSNQPHQGVPQTPQKEKGYDVWHYQISEHPISTYLIAFAIGDMEAMRLSERTLLYFESYIKEKAVADFKIYEKFVQAAESFFGPMPWSVADTVLLPPSFPMGGMENVGIIFDSPTIITGDGSLMCVAAHELAHYWFGDSVTNAHLPDFWINEGFTVWAERKILKKVYGEASYNMNAIEGISRIQDHLNTPGRSATTALAVTATFENPDEVVSFIPYEKGFLFVTWLERKFGEERFLDFVREYIATFAFSNLTAKDFVDFLKKKLPLEKVGIDDDDLDRWLYGPGIPAGAPVFKSPEMDEAKALAEKWIAESGGALPSLDATQWVWQMWAQFLMRFLEEQKIPAKILERLEKDYALNETPNAEIASLWYTLVAKYRYQKAYPHMEQFLERVGRVKLIRPIYNAWVRSGEKKRAEEIFAKTKPKLHALAIEEITKALR